MQTKKLTQSGWFLALVVLLCGSVFCCLNVAAPIANILLGQHDFPGPRREPIWMLHDGAHLTDLDRDGYNDILVWSLDPDGVTAISGRDGDVLWTHELRSSDASDSLLLAPRGGHLVYVSPAGKIVGIDRASGEGRFEVDLGASVVQYGVHDGAIVFATRDQFWFRLEPRRGHLSRIRPVDRLEHTPQIGNRWENRRVEWRLLDGSWDTRRPRVRDERVRRRWRSPGGRSVLVEERTQVDGRDTYVLARYEGDRLVWRSNVARDPGRAKPQAPYVEPRGDTIYVVYDLVGRSEALRRIAAFDVSSGARRWDTPLTCVSGYDIAYLRFSERRVFVANHCLEIVDRRSGRHIAQTGRPPR